MATYGIKDCANLHIFELATGNPFLYSDYANVSTNEWTSERVFATAKGSNAIAWDYNKQGTLTVELETFDLKWLAMLSGSDIVSGEKPIQRREVVYVGEGKTATIKGTPVTGSVQVVPVGSDLLEQIGEPLTETKATPVNTGEFKVEGNTITFATDAVVGEPYAVYFIENEVGVKSFTINASVFPKAFRVVGDIMIREKETGADKFAQIEYFNARPQGNFTVTMSANEPTNLSVVFDLFPDKANNLAEYKFI